MKPRQIGGFYTTLLKSICNWTSKRMLWINNWKFAMNKPKNALLSKTSWATIKGKTKVPIFPSFIFVCSECDVTAIWLPIALAAEFSFRMHVKCVDGTFNGRCESEWSDNRVIVSMKTSKIANPFQLFVDGFLHTHTHSYRQVKSLIVSALLMAISLNKSDLSGYHIQKTCWHRVKCFNLDPIEEPILLNGCNWISSLDLTSSHFCDS